MQKRIMKQLKRGTALVAAFALTVSGITVADVKAASKTPTLSEKEISIEKGELKKVKVEKKKSVTVKKVTWNIESGKKVVKLTKETKTYVTIKGLKKGTATVSAKIKVGKKTYTREVNVTVKAAKKANTKAPATKVPATKAPATKTPVPTKAPVVTDAPKPTDAPVITDAPKPTDAPVVTDAPKPTDAPVATKTPEATATVAPTTPSKATATPYPYITAQPDPTAVPDELDGVATKKDSWNKGMISSLPGIYAGKKIKITLQVREVGVKDPTGKVSISANYNGYPNFATIDLSNEWQTVEIVHRFGEFTNQWSSMYFTGKDVTDDMTMYIKNLSFEVLDEGDPLGGTVLQKSDWHKGVLGSLTKATHENKEIKISFSIRESGVENPTGTFFVQSNHYAGEYPKLKEDIPLTTDWTEVSFTYVIGEITNNYPSIYLNGEAITDDMEMFMKDFKIEVIGGVHATPTPVVTPAPVEPTTHDVYLAGETLYDAEKGGVYVSTSGATAWGQAFGKFGANSGLTDKKFSSVIVDLDFYKDGAKLDSIADWSQRVQVVVASNSSWGTAANQEATNSNVANGKTTLSGTDMVANAIVFQWKKAEAEITEYDAFLIKSIKLVEAPASEEPTSYVVSGSALGASASYTFNGLGQYATVAYVTLDKEKLAAAKKVTVNYTVSGDSNHTTETAAFQASIVNDPTKPWIVYGESGINKYGISNGQFTIELTDEQIADITGNATLIIATAGGVTGYKGSINLTEISIGEEKVSSPEVTYSESGLNRWGKTAEVDISGLSIDLSKYSTAKIEYTVNDETGFSNFQGIVKKGDASDPQYTPVNNTLTVTLDKVKTATGDSASVFIQTGEAGFKGSIEITKITFEK